MLKLTLRSASLVLIFSFLIEALATQRWWGEDLGIYPSYLADAQEPEGDDGRYDDQYYEDDYQDGQRVQRPRRARQRLMKDPVRRRRRYRGRKQYYEYRYGHWQYNDKAPTTKLHENQEGAFDEPYKWELDFDAELVRSSTDDGAGNTDAFGSFNFTTDVLYLFTQKFGAGPILQFEQKSLSSLNSQRTLAFGARVKYNFGLVDEDVWLLFVEGRVAFGSVSTTDSTTGEFLDANAIRQFGGGIGVHYFVDSNVALTAIVDFRIKSTDVGGVITKQNDLGLIRAGLSIFL